MLHSIVAPYHLGNRNVSVGAGPLHVVKSPIYQRIPASVQQVNAGDTCDWTEVNLHIAAAVMEARAKGSLPLILAGNCNSCLGTLSAIRDVNPGIIWFDAHGDFHTPETSISGSIEGMSLTMAARDFVPETNIILVGARDFDPGERERVRDRLLYISDADLPAHEPLPDLRTVYVHIDIDVLDLAISPGANSQGPGGLSVEKLAEALEFIFRRFEVAALAIVNYNPANDAEHRTRDIIVSLIERVGRLQAGAATR
jgi:arginase